MLGIYALYFCCMFLPRFIVCFYFEVDSVVCITSCFFNPVSTYTCGKLDCGSEPIGRETGGRGWAWTVSFKEEWESEEGGI